MKKYSKEELRTLMENHKLWLSENGGKQMCVKGAIITDYDFSNTDLYGAVFDRCKVLNCKFDYSVLSESIFNRCDCTGTTFLGVTALTVDFSGSNLSNCVFALADISGSMFTNCKLYKIDWSGSIQTDCVFDEVSGMSIGTN